MTVRSWHCLVLIAFTVVIVLSCATPPQPVDDAADSRLYETLYLLVNVKQSPFDDVRVRMALAMATDRNLVSRLRGDGDQQYIPARGLVPPYVGYVPLERLDVTVGARSYDVLAYDVAAARELLASAGYPGGRNIDGSVLTVEVLVNTDEETEKLTNVLRALWRDNLGVEVRVTSKPWRDYLATLDAFGFRGVAIAGRSVLMSEADTLLFSALFELEKAGWTQPETLAVLNTTRSLEDATEAARRLREVEARLLSQMPIIPLFSRTP
jgi:ABC-type transport system substrate-binding protein